MAKNKICHFEFRTRDPGRLRDFYGSMFAWKFNEADEGYVMIDTKNDELGGGIFKVDSAVPTGMSNFIEVDDLATYEERLRAKGGQVLMSAREVPGMGWFSVFTDPDGNVMSLWQTIKKKQAKKQAKIAKKAAKAERKQAKAEKKQAKAGADKPEKSKKNKKNKKEKQNRDAAI